MMSLTTHALAAREASPAKVAALRLLGVAEHQVDLRHGRERGWVDLRRAAGDHQPAAGPLAPGLADRLARLAHRLGGHRAGVEDHRVGQPRGAPPAAQTSDS